MTENVKEKKALVMPGDSNTILPPAIFRPATKELQGAFPYSCGKCKKEHSVRFEWQYFCVECMSKMDVRLG